MGVPILRLWNEDTGQFEEVMAIRGSDGRGVQSIEYSADTGLWTVVYTDGTSQTIEGPQAGESTAGEDGGYYIPTVAEDGTLTWKASKDGMPEVAGANILGPRGLQGEPGSDGVSVSSVEQTTTSSEDGGSNVITVTLSNGNKSTFTVKNGSKGSDGAAGRDGADGYTPVKGADYFTEDEKTEIAEQAAELVEVPEGFSGSYNDLKDVPSSFTPSSHAQAASTITAGTFAGQVVANGSGQTSGSYVLRNQKLSASEESPTVNGQICWVYE